MHLVGDQTLENVSEGVTRLSRAGTDNRKNLSAENSDHHGSDIRMI